MKIHFMQKNNTNDPMEREGSFYPLIKLNICVNCVVRFSEDGGNSTAIRLVTFVIFLFLVCLNTTYADPYIGAEWNPTGNPIGGGPGYSDSVRHQDADYYVTNKAELLTALSNGSSGEIIYVADWAEIDMTGEQDLYIPAGVTLASGRGRIFSDTISWGGLIFTNKKGGYSLFRVSGKNVRVTGLRFCGEFGNYREGVIPDTFDPGTGLKLFDIWQDSVEIDNCEFFGWGNIAVGDYADNNTFCHVHHCYFYNTTVSVQGVGCYNGGAGESATSHDLFEANLFDFVRQNIASNGDTTNSYEARYNLALEHGAAHGLDRHGWPSQGDWAGNRTVVHHNSVRNRGWGDNAVRIRGMPSDSAKIYENWFYYSTQDSAIKLWNPTNCLIYDNHYGTTPPPGVAERMPVAVANANIYSGTVPLTVTFTSTGSNDPDGSIAWYEWDFGDNSPIVRHASADYTFDDEGVYLVELTVHDNDGITASDTMHMHVFPTSVDSYYISVWVNDRYVDSDTGYFFKQILFDDWIIWESDIAGYPGWEHVTVNVTDSINTWNPDSVTIGLRVYCKKDMTGQIEVMETWWDDVAFFWGDLRNGDFESSSGMSVDDWTYSENEMWFWGGWASDDVRSGDGSFKIYYYVSYNCDAGDWAKVEQKVAVGNLGIASAGQGNTFYYLSSPYPNPSRHGSATSYQLSAKSAVTLKIYDICGRIVRTLVDDENEAGSYLVNWDGNDERGKRTASGVYFYKFVVNPCGVVNPAGETSQYSETKKLVVLR